MADEPTRSVKHKQDSSLVRAFSDVARGNASAVVSAGNSGAALVAGVFILERIDGILRPAIGSFLPTKSSSVFCLDLGANPDAKAEHLEQFAYMGKLYVQHVRGIQNPRIALLSNGAEAYKGSLITKQAFYRLSQQPDLNFVGNLESRDIIDDHADVLVCDGFTGNIMLKTMQGTARLITHWMKNEGERSWLRACALFLTQPLFAKLREKGDYAKRGGALLLVLKKPLIVAHGCSTAAAIEQALMFAHEIVSTGFMPRYNASLSAYLERKQVSAVDHVSSVRASEKQESATD
jgi:glycerol-3-phosphate acyltransferase PlsX